MSIEVQRKIVGCVMSIAGVLMYIKGAEAMGILWMCLGCNMVTNRH